VIPIRRSTFHPPEPRNAGSARPGRIGAVCGRSQFRKVPEIIEEYGPARVGDVVEAALAEEAFPGSVVPGLVLHKGERVVSAFSWAFFDDGTGHNARLESAAERPAWRDAFASARLVLPLARFVEGRAWFSDATGGSLAVAGLYRLGALPSGGPARRATMLTRPADDVVAPFHERMPVILPADLIGPWLGGEPVAVARLLTESPSLTAEPLTRPGPPPPEQPSLL
jgi:putative SOS response-associated peptidase YedK